jgi:hypothetical protein
MLLHSRNRLHALAALFSIYFLAACSENSNNGDGNGGTEPEVAPFQELYDQGVNRYLGQYSPMLSEESDGIVQHRFGAGDGPLCRNGSEYQMATFDQGSENLVIYLEDGGGCWSTFCAANTDATAGIGQVGLLDPNRGDNPVRDWNQVFVPYCDGGLHASDADRDVDLDGDGKVELQRGLRNLSAALDVAVNTFPSPRRILLTGESAGGFGTIFALPLVRYLYPDARIDVVDDSGVGVARPDQPEFLRMLLEEWNMGAYLPESCPDCLGDDGHLTNFLIWQLEQDESIKRGMLSYNRDFTIGVFFLGIGQDAFEEALYEEMAQLNEALPERNKSWIPAGVGHTFLRAEPDQTAGGVPVLDWVGYLLSDSEEWVSVGD